MKRIVLTQDYDVGIPINVGTIQKVMWGGKELTITSQETDEEIQIQVDLLGWRSNKEELLELERSV